MKLHIGCGERYLGADWLHYDIRKVGEHIDFIGKADDLSQFEDCSVEEIYACHLLEHFGRWQAEGVLREWYKKLIYGGKLRVAVPDFEAIMEEYSTSHNLESVKGLLYGGQDYEYNYHYNTFDYPSIKSLFEIVGFKNVSRYKWEDFLPASYDDYSRSYIPHMDFENGRLMSLNVIGFK